VGEGDGGGVWGAVGKGEGRRGRRRGGEGGEGTEGRMKSLWWSTRMKLDAANTLRSFTAPRPQRVGPPDQKLFDKLYQDLFFAPSLSPASAPRPPPTAPPPSGSHT